MMDEIEAPLALLTEAGDHLLLPSGGPPVEPTLRERARVLAPIARTILPVRAGPIERAVLTAELVRMSFANPEQIATIYDPARCPAALLPWLAFALSVDRWEDTWPEEIKRAVIAASPAIHRLKGTVASIRAALNVFGFRSAVVEWWMTEPPGEPGTFVVDVFVGQTLTPDDEDLFSATNQRAAVGAVEATKPVTRSHSLRLGVGVAGYAYSAGSAGSMMVDRYRGNVDPPPDVGGIGASGAAVSLLIDRAQAEVTL